MTYLFDAENSSSLRVYSGPWNANDFAKVSGFHRWLPTNFTDTSTISPPPQQAEGEEVAYLLQLAEFRTSASTEETDRQRDEIISDFFKVLNAQQIQLPETVKLMRDLIGFAEFPIMKLKHKFMRARPYQDPRLSQQLVFPVFHPAYPSGHSTQGHLCAFLLCTLFPTKRQALLSVAARIAFNRELAALHFPSDSQAGIDLARELYKILLNDSDFKSRLVAVKKEVP
jgi:membrane-associated phospholipid phosphatase